MLTLQISLKIILLSTLNGMNPFVRPPKVAGVVTVEEHTRIGGLGSAVLEHCSDVTPEHAAKIARIGFPDNFADKYGSQNSLLAHWGITVESLCELMRKQL